MNRWNKVIKLFLIPCLTFVCILDVMARAGGGGIGDIGGEDGIAQIVVQLIMYLPFPWNIFAAGTVIGAGYYLNKKYKQKTILNKIPATVLNLTDKLDKVKTLAPDFDFDSFSKKVRHAFFEIQTAWSEQSIRRIRKFISDGLYQRFYAQFLMMKQIEQKNIIENIEILDIKIIDIEVDGNYFVMDVAIAASMVDSYESKKYPSLNEIFDEPFIEIWTFIRKIELNKTANLYLDKHCPQCGAALKELESEACQCPYCKTILNTGEFDWILSEITQLDDYPIAKESSRNLYKFKKQLNSLYSRDSYFSVQWLEDKASNAFMQILIANALNDPLRLRRFSDDTFYKSFIPDEKVVYFRLFLNSVTLIGIWQQDNMDYLAFYINVSFRRLRELNNTIQWIDFALTSRPYVLILKRDVYAALPKGTIYSHQCPHCGGPIEDSPSVKCAYCGQPVNSPKHEWIVHQLLTPEEYQKHPIQNVSQKKRIPYDSIYEIRDYVINNICVILASDGKIDEMEIQFLKKLAKRFGYSPSKLSGFLNLAQKGQLKLICPANEKSKKKVLLLMKKAAESNQIITEEEKMVLSNFEKNVA